MGDGPRVKYTWDHGGKLISFLWKLRVYAHYRIRYVDTSFVDVVISDKSIPDK